MYQARIGYLFSGKPLTDSSVQEVLSQTLGNLPAEVEIVDGFRVVTIQFPSGTPMSVLDLVLRQKAKDEEGCTRFYCVVADRAGPQGLFVGC